MYLRLTRAHFTVASYPELVKGVGELIATLRHLPGFRGGYTALGRDDGLIVAVTFWETEDQARLDRAAFGMAIPHLLAAGLRLDPPEVAEVHDKIAGP